MLPWSHPVRHLPDPGALWTTEVLSQPALLVCPRGGGCSGPLPPALLWCKLSSKDRLGVAPGCIITTPSGNKRCSRLSAWLSSKALRRLTSFGTNFSVLISPLRFRISLELSPFARCNAPPLSPREASSTGSPPPGLEQMGGAEARAVT